MKNFNYQKNKQAFGQAKTETAPHGKHSFERSAREERRRWNRQQNIGLSKEQRLEKEFKEYVEKAWSESRHVPEIKTLELDPNFESWVQSRSLKEFQEVKGSKWEFFGFFEEPDENKFSSFKAPMEEKVYVKRIDDAKLERSTQELPKVMFRPCLDKEDLALYIMKKEIGL